MSQLILHFEMERAADPETAVKAVEQRLLEISDVEAAQASPEETRFGIAETVALIAAAVVLVKQGRELTDELRAFVVSLKALIKEVKGLKSVMVEVGDERVDVNDLDDSQIASLVSEQAV